MEELHEQYSKKYQSITDNYGNLVGKLGQEFEKVRSDATEAKDAALRGIPPNLAATNLEAFNSIINAIYKTYNDRIQKAQDTYNNSYKNITIVYNRDMDRLKISYEAAARNYHDKLQNYNKESNTRLHNLTQTSLNSIKPVTPRITTISSAR